MEWRDLSFSFIFISYNFEAADSRVPKRVKNANTALVYYSISFSCVFGGKKYNNKGSGKRPHQRYTELEVVIQDAGNSVTCIVIIGKIATFWYIQYIQVVIVTLWRLTTLNSRQAGSLSHKTSNKALSVFKL